MSNFDYEQRLFYFNKVVRLIDKPVIKVITGMRRVGKSFFLKQVKDYIIEQKLASVDEVIFIDKESLHFGFIKTYSDVYNYINGQDRKARYVFIDEVQNIVGWEKAVASLHGEGIDVYITGSNAQLLSSELTTYIAGRYFKVEIYPLSFKEFIQFNKLDKKDKEESFKEYLYYGGLPAITKFYNDKDGALSFVSDIFNTIILKDVVQRNSIRNISSLNSIIDFATNNIGNVLSAKKIADYFKSQQKRLSVDTVCNYLHFLCEAYAFYKVPRFDIKGKKILEIAEKYYICDVSLKHVLRGFKNGDIAVLLENIVFVELLRRGYKVYIGKLGEKEIDFIAENAGERIYIQVCYLLSSKETVTREFAPLDEIKDNYPKIVLTLDKFYSSDHNGISIINLVDWLLQ